MLKSAALALLAVVAVVGVSVSTAGVLKIKICHYPGSDNAEPLEIEIGDPAVETHLAHGDGLHDTRPRRRSNMSGGGERRRAGWPR